MAAIAVAACLLGTLARADTPVTFGKDGTVVMTGWSGGDQNVRRVYSLTFP